MIYPNDDFCFNVKNRNAACQTLPQAVTATNKILTLHVDYHKFCQFCAKMYTVPG